MDAVVWAGDEAPAWMRGGSYIVVRRARIALEHWDRMNVAFQEQTFGREKLSGAPLGAKAEFDPDRSRRQKRQWRSDLPRIRMCGSPMK